MNKSSKRFLSLALALALMVLCLSACGGNADQPSQSPSESQGAEKSPAPTDSAKPSDSANPPAPAAEQTLHTATISTGTADKGPYPWYNLGGATCNVLVNAMFRALLISDNTLQNVKGDLASDYKVSDDGLTYTFTMKDGVKWSDGEPVTAGDVAFSIKTILKTSVANGLFTGTFNGIVGASAWVDGSADDLEGVVVDGSTVTITLANPNSNFLPVMSEFMIMPEHSLKDVDPLELSNDSFWAKPVVCGRFMLTEMNPGNYYVLEQNPYYEGQQAKITKIINHLVADYTTAAEAGQVDYISTNDMDVVKGLSAMNNMQANPIDILFYRYFICNMEGVDGHSNPTMQNKAVREAVIRAIDRASLVPALLPDMGTIINSGVPASHAANDGVTYEYDAEAAKQLLQDAGYDFNHTFKILYYNTDQTTVNFLQACAEFLRQIGMNVELYQSQQGTTDMFTVRDYDICYKGLSAFSMTEYFGEYESTSATFKNIFGGDTDFDALINEYRSASSDDQKNEALKKLQALEHEKLYKLPLFTQGQMVFVNTDHVSLPSGLVFGNPNYVYDMQLENWEIIG